jgi:hypothetical protein
MLKNLLESKLAELGVSFAFGEGREIRIGAVSELEESGVALACQL